jgi:hypothetical protein
MRDVKISTRVSIVCESIFLGVKRKTNVDISEDKDFKTVAINTYCISTANMFKV